MNYSEYLIFPTSQQVRGIGGPELHELYLGITFLANKYPTGVFMLVGSAVERKDFDDVDILCVVEEDAFQDAYNNDMTMGSVWSVDMLSHSAWLSSVCGLKIDFKVIPKKLLYDEEHRNKIQLYPNAF